MAVATTQVTGATTAIPGLIVFDVTKVEDERGWFQEKFHREKLVNAGLPSTFTVVQTSIAFNQEGSTRGIHAEPWSTSFRRVDSGSAHQNVSRISRGRPCP